MRTSSFTRALAATLTISSGLIAADVSPSFSQQMNDYLQTQQGQEAVYNAIKAHHQHLQQAEEKNALEESFSHRANIEIGNSPVKGPKAAKVTIIMFADFQCPYAKRGRDRLIQVMETYPDSIQIVFKHFPLDFHDQAEAASKAGIAAHKQGKFWEMYDELFNNQNQLSDEGYLVAAGRLGLSIDQFKNDMASQEATDQISSDQKQGLENGVKGTPSFFINGVALYGAHPLESFQLIIDRLLKE